MAYADVISTDNFPAAKEGGETEPRAQRHPRGSPAAKLERWAQEDNIAFDLKDDLLDTIGQDAIRDYGIDDQSRAEWVQDMERGYDLALQVTKDKTYPFPGAANVVYPLVTTAALQFNARAYPALVDGRNIVKVKVNGKDPDGQKQARADRVSRHMSWQLLEQMDEWEEETDRELIQVPIVGCAFRKTYYDTVLGRNCSKLVSAMDFVVNDETTKSMESCPRSTEVCGYYRHEIETKFRKGTWREIDIEYDSEDTQRKEIFLEQHTLLDLDEDGYEEPWIVTVHKETQKVVCITACFEPEGIEVENGKIIRIERLQYYTKIPFLPHPKGRFYDLGFGFLLKSLNHTINSTLNMLLDAGHLANLPSGWIGRGPEMKAGMMRFRPGEFKPINSPGGVIRDAIVMNDFKGPNAVLMQLLLFLVEAGQGITSVQNEMTGDVNPNIQPTTLLAQIEQGMKQMVTIFKRIMRARKKEYQKLYRLNRVHMNDVEEFNFHDEPMEVWRADYEDERLDISPAADPNMVSDTQKLTRAQALMQWRAMSPLANQAEVDKRYLLALGVEDADKLIGEPPPDIEGQQREAELAQENMKLRISFMDSVTKRGEARAKVMLMLAQAEKAASEGEAVMPGMQLEQIRQLAAMYERQAAMDMETLNAFSGQTSGNAGGPGEMAGPPGDAGGSPVLPGLRSADAGPVVGETGQPDLQSGGVPA